MKTTEQIAEDDMNDPEYAPWVPRRRTLDIFHERWGNGSQYAFTSDWLRVWRHRADLNRAAFRRDLRRARNIFAVRMAAVQVEGDTN